MVDGCSELLCTLTSSHSYSYDGSAFAIFREDISRRKQPFYSEERFVIAQDMEVVENLSRRPVYHRRPDERESIDSPSKRPRIHK